MGNDRVLIGVYQDDTSGYQTGAAYLFNTNGALITTFSNPTPAVGDHFGYSVAAIGSARVLIGTPNDSDSTIAGNAGAAYMFRTNGSLLMTFTNPMPANSDHFGFSVAAVGSDRVLIGTPFNDTGEDAAGVAYLFSINGTLLTTFTNPMPTDEACFGWSVAAVGTDRVLIGTLTGSAYLFSTNSALLTTFTNPTPANDDEFGYSVVAVGTDRVLIGSHSDNSGATAAGAAYLFSTAKMSGLPSLTIRLTSTNSVTVSWPSPSTGWMLQENTNGVASINWSNAPGTIQDNGTTKTLIINPPTGNRFYRLAKP